MAAAALVLASTPMAVGSGSGSGSGGWVASDLPTLGGDRCFARGVSEAGEVAGSCQGPQSPATAVMWRRGRAINLAKGLNDASVAAINGRGEVAGVVVDASLNGVRAVLWRNGRMTNLGTLGANFSKASALNELGHVVAVTWHDTVQGYPPRCFLWRAAQKVEIGPRGGAKCEAVALNKHDAVIGWWWRNANYETLRPYLWQRGRLRELTYRGTAWQPVAINDRTEIIGNTTSAWLLGAERAYLWRKGKLIDLGTLGGPYSHASAINNQGQIVGWSRTKGGQQHAFLWQNGRMTDLGTLGGTMSEANAINEHGQIAGAATLRTGAAQAFFWERGRMTALPAVVAHGYGTKRGIERYRVVGLNERGDVAAEAYFRPDPYVGEISHAVLWTRR